MTHRQHGESGREGGREGVREGGKGGRGGREGGREKRKKENERSDACGRLVFFFSAVTCTWQLVSTPMLWISWERMDGSTGQH